MKLERRDAEVFAGWFRALADPSRILVLHFLATRRRACAVGEIVEALGLAQSTVSHHLKKLAAVRFVLVERHGTSNRYRVNHRCLARFPDAAKLVMGRARSVAPQDVARARGGRARP